MGYHGIDGFLGTRASIMLDIVFLAMFAIIPVMGWSIWLVRCRRHYALHKRCNSALGLLLAVAVGLFEIDMRFVSGCAIVPRLLPTSRPPAIPARSRTWSARNC